MAMRPMVARVETTTEFAGIIFAEDSRRPLSEIVRFVAMISEMKSVAGRSDERRPRNPAAPILFHVGLGNAAAFNSKEAPLAERDERKR